MEAGDQSSLELGEVEVKISKFALHLSTPSALIIQNSLKSVRIKSGEEFSLICEVHGRPIPTILWYKNNLQIKRQWFHYSFVNYGIRIINSRTSELKYQSVTTSDSGNYTCHAQNVYGHVQKSINIEVQCVTTAQSAAPHSSTTKTITSKPHSVFENKVFFEKPCLSDHDCLRNPCRMNNSVGKRISYKTCVTNTFPYGANQNLWRSTKSFKISSNCSGKNISPKCQMVEFRKHQIYSNNEQIEQNSFKSCKDGCDPNTSRLFLLSVLSLLLFLLIVFLIMVFITKRQRSRYKLTYTSTKSTANTNKDKQESFPFNKQMSLLDSSNNPSPSFNWEASNIPLYSDGRTYYTIQTNNKPNGQFQYLENTNQLSYDYDNQISKSQKLLTSSTMEIESKSTNKNFNKKQIPLSMRKRDSKYIPSNFVMKTLNAQHRASQDSSSMQSLNEIF